MLNSLRSAVLVFSITLPLSLAGCNDKDKADTGPKPAAAKSLYDRLGGENAITAVVDDFVNRGAANPKVNFTRKGVPGHEWSATPQNVEKLKRQLVEFIAANTGGPQKYTGRDMVTVHKGMKITNAEFDALAGDLKASLDKFNVPQKEQQELLTIVGSTKPQIVEMPTR